MGYVKANGILGGAEKEVDVEFLVDTGSYYVIVPPKLATEVGIKTFKELGFKRGTIAPLTLADSRSVDVQLGVAYVKVMGREGVFTTALLDAPAPLLGVEALEGLGLRPNTATGEIEFSRPFGLSALQSSLLSYS